MHQRSISKMILKAILPEGTPLHWACSRSGNNRGHRNMIKMMFNMILSFDLNSVTVDIMMTHIFVIWSMSLSNQR